MADRWHLLYNARQMLQCWLHGVHAQFECLPPVPGLEPASAARCTHAYRRTAADTLAGLSGHRRQQVWAAAALRAATALLREAPVGEDVLELPAAPEGEELVWDYRSLGLTLRRHPLALLRPRLEQRRLLSAAQLQGVADGRMASAGIVTLRQQPETARGMVFVSLEDETGTVQVIVWRKVRDAQSQAVLGARLLAVHGARQRHGEVCSLIAGRLEDLTALLGRLATGSRDFR